LPSPALSPAGDIKIRNQAAGPTVMDLGHVPAKLHCCRVCSSRFRVRGLLQTAVEALPGRSREGMTSCRSGLVEVPGAVLARLVG